MKLSVLEGILLTFCIILILALSAYIACDIAFDNAKPVAPDLPTIKGKGYEAIIGWEGHERTFLNGIEYPVKDIQKKLGCKKLDGVVGGETIKKMRDFNGLEVFY